MEPNVEPEPRCDAASLVGAFKFGLVLCRVLGRFQTLHVANNREDGSVDSACALFGGVHQPELDRVDVQFQGQSVHYLLSGKGYVGGGGSAVGCNLGLVDENVVAVGLHVFNVVRGKDALRASADH